MNSQSYVWEKMYDAVDCLCGAGTFGERLAGATISALIRLDVSDLSGELAADLAFILKWTKHNLKGGAAIQLPDDLERKELIEKMLHVLLELERKKA